MECKIKNISAGEVIKIMRKSKNISQEKLSKAILKSRVWLAKKEINREKIYIKDFINIMNTLNYEIIFSSNKYGIELYLSKYEPNLFFRFFREATNSTQSSFAMTIGKTNDWAYTIEAGVNEY